jgi:hypothetical protein
MSLLPEVEKAIKAVKRKPRNRASLYDSDLQTLSSWDAYKWYREFPAFNNIYVESIMEKYKVLRHTSPRVFPSEVLRSKAPNQSPAEWQYQCGMYKPKTVAVWNRAVNKTKVIANKQNYSIEWADEQEEQKKYFYTDFPIYSDLVSWVFEVLAVEKINFPNRVCVVYPDVPKKADGTPDQSVPPNPIPIIIDEENVVYFQYGQKCLYLTSWELGRMEFVGVDRENFYHYVQDGESITETVTYSHNWGFLPAFKLGGKAEEVDGEILYTSFFADAIPTLDEAIQVGSNLMMSHFKLAYPIIIEVVDDCDHCRGSGKVWDEAKQVNVDCGHCNGTGTKSGLSPTSTYQVRATKGMGQDNNLPLTPPVQFAAPNSDILRYGKEMYDDLLDSAFDFTQKAKKADAATATEVATNRDEWQSFLIDFSNQVFDMMDFLFESIGFMRNGKEFKKPVIRRPTEFSFKTNAEITAELKEAKLAGLPAIAISKLLGDWGNSRFNTTDLFRELEFMQRVDKYWHMSFEQLRMMNGQLSAEDFALHIGYSTIIANLEGNGEWWELPFETREAQVREKAQEMAASMRQANTMGDVVDLLLNSNTN